MEVNIEVMDGPEGRELMEIAEVLEKRIATTLDRIAGNAERQTDLLNRQVVAQEKLVELFERWYRSWIYQRPDGR